LDDPLQQVKAKAAATYDTAADHFDDEPLGFWKRIGERTVDCLALPPGANVLDVGCGTGASALPAAQVVGPNGFVVGVDLSARLLDLARTKAAMHRLRNVEFRLADMCRRECFFDFLRARYGRLGAVCCGMVASLTLTS
jgi:ubiquinone/menaquinone biosynthesis C-methylase UbiE